MFHLVWVSSRGTNLIVLFRFHGISPVRKRLTSQLRTPSFDEIKDSDSLTFTVCSDGPLFVSRGRMNSRHVRKRFYNTKVRRKPFDRT